MCVARRHDVHSQRMTNVKYIWCPILLNAHTPAGECRALTVFYEGPYIMYAAPRHEAPRQMAIKG